ncbi:MAG: SPASM domain-containing protein [Candidatus Gastranaerophilaceae bacterium]
MNNDELLKKAKEFLGKPLKCAMPFESFYVYSSGEVYNCCPAFMKEQLGNIFEQNFDELWNGEKAQKIRQSILDGNFEYCPLDRCVFNLERDSKFVFDYSLYQNSIAPLPKNVELNIDRNCNAKCIMCRDCNQFNPTDVKKFEEIIDSKLIPIMQNAETVYINGVGEVFVSNLCKKLIKKITAIYPKIKFRIITNGILATEENVKELGLDGRLKSVEISIHAATKETYDKIVRGGDFDAVMKNLRYFAKKKKEGEIEYIQATFVVSSINYREMIDFQKMVNDLEIASSFWEYRKYGGAEMDKNYDEIAVFEPYHPEHDQFVKIVNNDIFKNWNCDMGNKIRPLC